MPHFLTDQLQAIHARMMQSMPELDRVACAIYDAPTDELRTFLNSTRKGQAIAGYGYPLAKSQALSALAKSGAYRIITDIPHALEPSNPHSAWVLAQNYQASMTVPMFWSGVFIGFIFMDSCTPGVFTPAAQRDLMLYCSLINMAVVADLAAARTILAAANVATEFSTQHDFETGTHLERVARYARIIAAGLAAQRGLKDEFVELVFRFAPLHDVGKIAIPDAILLKPGAFTPDERRLMQSHVDHGAQIIRKLLGDFNLQDLPGSEVMLNIVACHHELLDGSGYPRGLQGAAIPLEARIVTVADIFDALNSRRPYKPAWGLADTLAELQAMAAQGKLDGDCVAALVAAQDQVAQVMAQFPEAAPA